MGTVVSEPTKKKTTTLSPAVWVWLALLAGLGAAFLVDSSVMALLKPLRDSELTHLLHHTVRMLGVGYVQAVVLLLLVLGGWAMRRPRALAAGGWALLALAASGALANILKVLVHRPRPWVTLPPPDSWLGYVRVHEFQSFPSGESTTTFAVAVSLSAWFPKLRVPLMTVAVAVAAARVVVGNHFPSDVWAGAMLGVAVGQWVAHTARRRAQGADSPA